MDRILKSKYKILDKIAESPSHIAYKGILVDNNAPLVIKIFKREYLNSPLIKILKKDALRLMKLEDQSIPRLLDADYGWQGFYYIREYIDGKPLSAINLPVEPEAAADIAVKVCDSLNYAHSKGVVHGSLTPKNIFISSGLKVRVADFGIKSSVFGAVDQKAALLLDDSSAYLSPEVLLGEDPSPASDIYQLGLLLYLMLTGTLPVKTGNGLDHVLSNISAKFPAPSTVNNKVPRYIDEIVMRCLEKDPLMRFESAGQLSESLKNKALMAAKSEAIEIPGGSFAPEEPPQEKKEEVRPSIERPIFHRPIEQPRNTGKGNMFRWVMLAIWAAIAAGIIYSLINIFLMGE